MMYSIFDIKEGGDVMNLMARDYLDQMIAYNELRSKNKHNDKIDSMIDSMISLKSIMGKSDSIIVKRHISADATTESRGLRSTISFHDELVDPLTMKTVPCITIDSIPDLTSHSMAKHLIDIPRYIGNHTCFYPIDITSLSGHTISCLLYNENECDRRMTISERVSLDIKILIMETRERYRSSSLKSTISDHLSYSDHRLTVRDFSKLPKLDPLNYDPVIPRGRGMTHPIIFEPWI